MTDFKPFSQAVRAKFDSLSQKELFTVNIDGDVLWNIYLDAFPAGTNEVYKTRREYDCSCCKNFIRNVAGVVGIVNNQLVTIWDVDGLPYPFDVVAAKLSATVHEAMVDGVYRTREKSYGAELTRGLDDTGKVINWNHFNAKLNEAHVCEEVGTILGEKATSAQVFKRGLEELTESAVATVLDLIDSDSLYRGMEYKAKVLGFSKMQRAYNKLNSDQARNLFIWSNINDLSVARFRGSVIGELAIALSDGTDLERAVGAFEAMVAPTNYKRSKALITPAMIKDAMKTISDLGLEKALERRFARISDVTINNVLFVDNSVRPSMKDGIEGLLMSAVQPTQKKIANVEDIGIEDFMSNIVPNVTSIEVMVKNGLAANFMSLTAPVHDDVERLFKWDNNFAWSYDGNITDSHIKEKVRLAGGNVTNAALRVSLSWFNFDDLDIHVKEPNGRAISFMNPDGKLDVDMNAGRGQTRQAVENVSWTPSNLKDGIYQVAVNNFRRRESIDVGFIIEVENAGVIHNFNYNKGVSDGQTVKVIDITVTGGRIADIKSHKDITGVMKSVDKWGVKTESMVPVNALILSPNYWDGNATGNKHWFFILKDCINPEPTRGIYNEFLKPELEKHRKVFEVLGDKTKCVPTDSQLSGLGFSSTKRETLVASVKGDKINKTYNINF